MRINRCFKAESFKKAVIESAKSVFMLKAHAEETTPNGGDTSTASTQPQINYENLIAAARKEEKDKLYPRITKLEEENKKQVEINNNNLIKIGDLMETVKRLEEENKTLKSNVNDSQTVKDLNAKIAELEAENKKLKESTPDEAALRAEIEKEYEVKAYIMEQKNANKDDILSTFLENITGATKEEVDSAIQSAKDKTISIKKDLGLLDSEGKPTEKTSAKKTEEKKKTSTPKANPTADSGSTKLAYDIDYVRNLDPSSEEYKEFRKSLGLR